MPGLRADDDSSKVLSKRPCFRMLIAILIFSEGGNCNEYHKVSRFIISSKYIVGKSLCPEQVLAVLKLYEEGVQAVHEIDSIAQRRYIMAHCPCHFIASECLVLLLAVAF